MHCHPYQHNSFEEEDMKKNKPKFKYSPEIPPNLIKKEGNITYFDPYVFDNYVLWVFFHQHWYTKNHW